MLSALAGATLCLAGLTDLRWRIIPNALPVLLALSAVAHALLLGDLEGLGVRALIALAVFLGGLVLFSVGLAGGGDVKLATATMLWLPPASVGAFFLLTALAGGALALAVLMVRGLRRIAGDGALENVATVPYGCAIAFGACLILLAQP